MQTIEVRQILGWDVWLATGRVSSHQNISKCLNLCRIGFASTE